MKSLIIKFIPLLLLICLVTSCEDDFTSPQSPEGASITDIIASSTDHDILDSALIKTGLSTIYSNNNAGTFTLLAPTDDAFVNFFRSLVNPPSNIVLPPGSPAAATLDEAAVLTIIRKLQFAYPSPPAPSLPNNVNYLTINSLAGILNYHVLSSEIPSSMITGTQTFNAVNNSRMSFSVQNAQVLINANINVNNNGSGATVTTADIEASNGIIHTIDKVMRPPSSATVLASLGINGVNYGTNPPTITRGTGAAALTGTAPTGGDATGTDYDILAYALIKTELYKVLQPNQGTLPEFTVFAPDDNAMRAYLGNTAPASATVENAAMVAISNLSGEALADFTDLLKYHVVSNRALSSDLSNGLSLSTALTGKNLTVNINGAVVELRDLDGDDATFSVVSAANILTNSGVVHRINRVLRPKS
jgi:uncharacterized surface protein with fasciclin (FAS1) repeats